MQSEAEREWLEADGHGGFACGTATGVRTRRYHGLLLVATTPPTGRMMLVNGFDAWITTPTGTFALSSQRYVPDVIHPDASGRIASFAYDPWPRWTFQLEDGTVVQQEIFVPQQAGVVVVTWRLSGPSSGVTLAARPLLSGRDYHALHHENPVFRFDAQVSSEPVGSRPYPDFDADVSSEEVGPGSHTDFDTDVSSEQLEPPPFTAFAAEASYERVQWQPYPGIPAVVAISNASYAHGPEWYRNFQYDEELARGLDFTEDLASPGVFTWDLSNGGEAVWILAAAGGSSNALQMGESADEAVNRWRDAERVRRVASSTSSPLVRSASAYTVTRGTGRTILAGYPWFTDWGRDTFIAMRGLCLATGRLADARDILLQWAGSVSEGMLPNRFPDAGEQPEYNAVDASLWFIIAVHDFLEAGKKRNWAVARSDQESLRAAVDAILDGYMLGTRYGIRCDADGLLAAGEPGVQLTWMDAMVGNRVVTPRIGKPVEVQALWLAALRIGSTFSEQRLTVLRNGSRAFMERFWNEAGGYLYDVIDVNHHAGVVDASFRPNQIFAVGGLPFSLLTGDRARQVVDAVEARLLTPMGLRSLGPDDHRYVPHYQGSPRERDEAYHQGTVWPWLIGPFVEAWVRVRGSTTEAKREARERFLTPLLKHVDEAGLGHISEIADGDAPYRPRGCPFQAWSVGEVLRLDITVLAE